MFRSPKLRLEEMRREIVQAETQEKACGNWPPTGPRRDYLLSCYDAVEVLEDQARRFEFLEIPEEKKRGNVQIVVRREI